MLEWTNLIIGTVFGGTSVFGIIEAIKYRKENKQIKGAEASTAKAEATKVDIEVQKEKMDLGDTYLKKVLEMSETINTVAADTKNNNKAILDTQSKLQEGFEKLNIEVSNIVTYLNGDYQSYLKGNKSKHYLKKDMCKEKKIKNYE